MRRRRGESVGSYAARSLKRFAFNLLVSALGLLLVLFLVQRAGESLKQNAMRMARPAAVTTP
jgi:hypothetical protein